MDNNQKAIRVVLVERDKKILKFLVDQFDCKEIYKVVKVCTEEEEILPLLRVYSFDVLITQIGYNWKSVFKLIFKHYPNLKAIAFRSDMDIVPETEIKSIGFSGTISKDEKLEKLFVAIDEVMNGAEFFNR